MQTEIQETTFTPQTETVQIPQPETVMQIPVELNSGVLAQTDAQAVTVSRFGNKSTRQLALIAMIFIAFIALGLPDGLLGVGWPSIRTSFGVPLDSLGLLLTTSMTGYLLSSFFSGAIERRLGVGKILIISCLLTGLGLLGYTIVPQWWMMVGLGLLAGLGAGGIDSSLNAYVAGNYGPGLMQWLHASYGIGVTIGPLLMTFFLTNMAKWRPAYQVVGGFQLLLAFVFFLSLSLWPKAARGVKHATAEKAKLDANRPGLFQTLKKGSTLIGLLQFFIYTGCEVALGMWAYSLLTEGRGVVSGLAGLITGSFWAFFTVGRILAGLLAYKLKMRKLVMLALGLALIGAVLLAWNQSPTFSLIAVSLIGFSYAPIFPGLVTGTESRVGKRHLTNAVGMQTASAGLGGTVIASVVGVLARRFGLNVVPFILVGLIALLIVVVYFANRMQANEEPLSA
ncbi:MAG TPA: MFS transporter [Anaerolineaceae bacterium]|nr:MFS transporter [Anaerolineaceae bacterium]